METNQNQDELVDVALCYQAMGLSLDATPSEVAKTYQAISADYRRKIASGDPAAKAEAQDAQELLDQMYDKIRSSVTYRSAERAAEKAGEGGGRPAEAAVKAVHNVVAERGLMTLCPNCNGSIVIGTRQCPICKKTIYTPMEKFMNLFTVKRIVLLVVLLAAAAAAFIALAHPELLPGRAPESDIFDKVK